MPLRDRLGEAQLAGDLGAALAAGLDQLVGDLAAILQMLKIAAEALASPAFKPVWRQDEAQRPAADCRRPS